MITASGSRSFFATDSSTYSSLDWPRDTAIEVT
jgi:hypothetical protein